MTRHFVHWSFAGFWQSSHSFFTPLGFASGLIVADIPDKFTRCCFSLQNVLKLILLLRTYIFLWPQAVSTVFQLHISSRSNSCLAFVFHNGSHGDDLGEAEEDLSAPAIFMFYICFVFIYAMYSFVFNSSVIIAFQ